MQRKSIDDRLGLTLYYRDTHGGTSDVIVGEVGTVNVLYSIDTYILGRADND